MHMSEIDNVKLICPSSCERTDISEAGTTPLWSVGCLGGRSVWGGRGSIKVIEYFLYLGCDVDFILDKIQEGHLIPLKCFM